MTLTTGRLATEFERASQDAIDLIEHARPDRWLTTSGAEGWTVAALARHLATGVEAELRALQALIDGKTIDLDWSALHERNAERAGRNAAAPREETLAMVREQCAAAAAAIRGLSPEQLEAGDFQVDGRHLNAGQYIEAIMIGHFAMHRESLAAAG